MVIRCGKIITWRRSHRPIYATDDGYLSIDVIKFLIKRKKKKKECRKYYDR